MYSRKSTDSTILIGPFGNAIIRKRRDPAKVKLSPLGFNSR